MPSKSLLDRGFPKKAEKIAEDYRAALRISKFDPLDAFLLAEYIGTSIFSVDNAFEGNTEHPQYYLMQDVEKFSAMWMPNEDGDKIIIHNTNHSKFRQQSNLMHELSHIILKHEIPDEYAKLCLQLNLHYYDKKQEQEAKYLGGCLQITKPGLQWALKRNWNTEQISEYYSASTDMVNYRLGISGVRRIRYHQSLKKSM